MKAGTNLFEQLVCELANKGIAIVCVAVNEVNQSATLRVWSVWIRSGVGEKRKGCTSGTLDADTHHAHSEPPVIQPDIQTPQSESRFFVCYVVVGIWIL